jgi:hypothetical protein
LGSKDGCAYTADELFKYLVQTLIPEISRRGGIPNSTTMDLPSRKVTTQLGTRTVDLDNLDELHENKKQEAIEEAVAIRNQMERLQPARTEVDDDLINAEIEILYSYVEPDGSTKNMWCQGKVVAVQTCN